VAEERAVRRLPWTIFGVAALMSTTGIVLLAYVPAAVLERAGNSLALSAVFAAILLVFGLVGAVVASRLPSNPIGWLFLAVALNDGIYQLAHSYARYTLGADPGALPNVEWAAWLAEWTGALAPPFLVAALLLFPDGRPLSPRWRWAVWLCAPVGVLVLMHYGLAPGPLVEFPSLSNPLGIAAAPWLGEIETETLYAPLFVAGAAALVVRLRRSHGVERQQVKWFAYAAGLMAAMLTLGSVLISAFEADEDSIASGVVRDTMQPAHVSLWLRSPQ